MIKIFVVNNMRRRKKILIAILLVILLGLVVSIVNALYFPDGDNGFLAEGNRTVLVCAIDESEIRAGMGACDMAFVVYLQDGHIANYTAIYPNGMTHPTASEPAEYVAMGAGEQLLLHDAFYSSNNTQGMLYAKEIVEYNTNIPIDAVVCINSEGVSNLMNVVNPITINGQQMNVSGIDIIREDQYGNGDSRGDAVLNLVKAVAEKAKQPEYKADLVSTALSEFNKGNIIMYPEGAFVGLLATKGLTSTFG